MTDADALAISQDFADMATTATNMVSDLTLGLTAQERQKLNSFVTVLTGDSNQFATAGALAALAGAQSDIDSIKKSTADANAQSKALAASAAKVNAVLSILGAAVGLGASLIAGPLATAVSAAGTLATAVSSA